MSTGAATRSLRPLAAYRRLRAITVYQPWAQLIAYGLKPIETRSWRTKYRGPIAIHAAAATNFGGATLTSAQFEDLTRRCVERGLSCDCGHPGNDHDQAVGCLRGCPCRRLAPDWPLGAVVATARLADCVPIYRPVPVGAEAPYIHVYADGVLGLAKPDSDLCEWIDRDQRTLGDFSAGRFAWLLEDIQPTTQRCPACWDPDSSDDEHRVLPACPVCSGTRVCDPIPARGRQGLWRWAPDNEEARRV